MVEQLTCKYCGANAELRKGRFGMFVACSNYRHCKHIRPPASKRRYQGYPSDSLIADYELYSQDMGDR